MRKTLFGLVIYMSVAALPFGSPLADTIQLPDMGQKADNLVSPEEERRIGDAIMRQLRDSGKVITDEELNRYINGLGLKLVSTSGYSGSRFTFFIIDDPTINAAAYPGGYIGVNSGLILATRSESELASVLAHEIAHVTQHHLLRSFEKSNKTNVPLTAGVIAAILLGARNPQLGQAVISASAAGSMQTMLDFTRANEQEADRIGIQMLDLAGFDPRSMPAFFDTLAQQTRLYGGDMPEFLRTHPVTASRIADTRNRAEQYPHRKEPDATNYELAKSKLEVMAAADPDALVQGLKNDLRQGRYQDKDIARYRLALALQRAGKPAAAVQELERLIRHSTPRIAFFLAKAHAETAAGDAPKALKTCRGALKLFPDSGSLTLGYGETLLATGKTTEASGLLQGYLQNHDASAPLYDLLARVENRLGNTIASRMALAEFHYLRGEPHAAIEQLRLARKEKAIDFYHAARIDARLKELEESVRTTEKHASPNAPFWGENRLRFGRQRN